MHRRREEIIFICNKEVGGEFISVVDFKDGIYRFFYYNISDFEQLIKICPNGKTIYDGRLFTLKELFKLELEKKFLLENLVVRYQKIFKFETLEPIGAEFFCNPQNVPIRFSNYLAPEVKMLFDKRSFDLLVRKTKTWRENGLAFINFFSSSWNYKLFMAYIYKTIKKGKYKNLVIEILESKLSEELREFFLCLKRRYGVMFALDDFGSENASIDRLVRFDFVDFVKIDKQILWNEKLFNWSKSLIKEISKEFKVIIEGVENKEQLEKVKELNPYAVQGFFLHKPTFLAF
jgi:EAL domain-containing protein (putative c-di-GMP-specific phosphodiesterase class I)